ncbi:MAG: hypothetical protein HYU37_14410 [Acidobacteria bacterium]|nr:hypothetical protein [Acidobacteriota bacterium]
MRLAWFRPSTFARDALSNVEGRPAPCAPASLSDATALLIAELATAHDLDLYTRDNAHDFVWTHFRHPYELCVFELDNTAAHAFIWPYLLHYDGVLLLASSTLHDSRARTLVGAGRTDDYASEFLFNERRAPRPQRRPSVPEGDWPMLRAPLTAARLTVVPHRGLAEALRDEYPDARIAFAPLAVRPPEPFPRSTGPDVPVTFGVLGRGRVDAARRALARAQALGAAASLVVADTAEEVLRAADVLIAVTWPPRSETEQLPRTALAAGVPVVALETILTTDWPALDPQTWHPRAMSTDPPIAVTVDLRDEEHSLALAIRRLSADAALRSQLGEAARAWSDAHESVAVAVEAWQRLLAEAARLDPPPRPADWPSHLSPDGTERARAMLAEFGVQVDLF